MPIINQQPKGLTEYELTIRCPQCKQNRTIVVDANKFNRWRGGKLIQQVFPDMDANEREALITGICSTCWDKLFEGMEDSDIQDLPDEDLSEC